VITVAPSFLNSLVASRAFLACDMPSHRPLQFPTFSFHSYFHSQDTFGDTFNVATHSRLPPTYHPKVPPAHSTMSLLTPPPTGARPPPSDSPIVVRFLDAHLEHGALQPHSYDKLYRVIQAIGEISLLLFPHSESLDTISTRRIEALAHSIVDTFYAFGEHIDGKLWRAKQAMEELPNLAVRADEKRQRNLRAWQKRLQ